MRKVIIEARLNEYADRRENPNIPWSCDEIVTDARDCATAGASIVHFHARTADGGPSHSFESYRDIVASLRECSPILIHPTLGVETLHGDAAQRLDAVSRLAEAGLSPDVAPMDMMSTNLDGFDRVRKQFLSEDKTYVNTTGTLRRIAASLQSMHIIPYAQVWNIPALRLVECFVEAGIFTDRRFVSLGMSAGSAISGHPATTAGLQSYLSALPDKLDMTWTAMVYGGNILPLVPEIVRLGGHISLGLGDHAHSELGYPSNPELVEEVVKMVRAENAEIASPEEAREMLRRSLV